MTQNQKRHPAVFVSYAHADAEFANRLVADLRAKGFECWSDSSAIRAGAQWTRSIAEGIANSSTVLVVVTQQALQSDWVEKEILWAQQQPEKKLVIPLLLENVTHEPGFIQLVNIQAVMFFGRDYALALEELLRALPDFSVSRQLELNYLAWLKQEELIYIDRYTPLGGGLQQQRRARMRVVCSLEPFDRLQPVRPFVDAVKEIQRIRRAVLLGEPGGGKTTILWKLADDLAVAACQDDAEPIPLLIRLGFWDQAEQTLSEFIASQLQEAGELGMHLDTLLAQNRAALLLDGLNELPVAQRAVKYPQIRQFIENHPKLLAVVSCRKEDYAPHYDFDLGCDRINVLPLDVMRIRQFAVRYLPEQGEAFFWKLAGERTRGFYDDFLTQVGAQHEEQFWLAEQPPQNLKWTYAWDDENEYSRWTEWISHRETPSGLMMLSRNPYMLWMLIRVYAEHGELPANRGDLFRKFVEELLEREKLPAAEWPPLIEGLAQVAYALQSQRSPDSEGGKTGAGNALTVLPLQEVRNILDEPSLKLAGQASLLNPGEQVRFTHQLLQEYFAARYLQNRMSDGLSAAAALWPPERWWQRTNWEEVAILLAGLYPKDCSAVVEWIATANPEVAAQCATRSGADPLPVATLERLRKQWIPRLTDLINDPQPQARAAVGRALGLLDLDNRKGVGTVRDRSGVLLPDFDWVEIPGGEFQYGDESEEDNKPRILTLPAFYISRFPVTYTQFQTFLDDPAGYADPRWFEGLAVDDDDHRISEQNFKFPNHPRDNVNWFQAIAFCRWLSWRLGGGTGLKKVADWAVRLPTEFEWEKAARGVDGRLYPYGNEFDAAKGNFRAGKNPIGQTSAVGIFPNGASPNSVEEMSGNVWEWCLSNYDSPALDVRKENLQTDNRRVLRGGAWYDPQLTAPAVYREETGYPARRNFMFGFRVVLLRPPSS